jgi:hypothetical protein
MRPLPRPPSLHTHPNQSQRRRRQLQSHNPINPPNRSCCDPRQPGNQHQFWQLDGLRLGFARTDLAGVQERELAATTGGAGVGDGDVKRMWAVGGVAGEASRNPECGLHLQRPPSAPHCRSWPCARAPCCDCAESMLCFFVFVFVFTPNKGHPLVRCILYRVKNDPVTFG